MNEEKIIRITCEGATRLPLSEFEEFQGELKSLDRDRYEKLKASIIDDGFHTTIDVWRKPGEKKPRKMLDGHQRVRSVRMMIQKEGFTLEGDALPVDWIEAETEEQANRIVLSKLSQYGIYTEDSMYEFIHERGLDWDSLRKQVDFPRFNMGSFHVGWMAELVQPEPKPNGDGDEKLDPKPKKKIKCPSCGTVF